MDSLVDWLVVTSEGLGRGFILHSISNFSFRLISWQQQHGRHDLPWQGAYAYRVWLSEIMLQQTQVATVIPYYQRFIASFPTIAALAAADEEQVLTHWSGLGYYARGRNLHRAAQIIMEKHHGQFPHEFEQILELPGIGRSTAAAICALAWHERRAILDGNVKRVLARYCGIEGWAGDKKVEAQLWRQAENLLPPSCRGRAGEEVEMQLASTPILAFPLQGGRDRLAANELPAKNSDIATYTQALMDMGATVCTRSKPKCAICPVQTGCVALQTERIAELPAPRPKKVVPERHATFLLLLHGNDILLEKRPSSGIWGGLWCPPQLDDVSEVADYLQRNGMAMSERIEGRHSRAGGKTSRLRRVSRDGHPANSINQCEALSSFTHTFTHFKLHITPLKIQLASKPLHAAQPGSVWLDVEEALRVAIPTPVRAMLNKVVRGEFL